MDIAGNLLIGQSARRGTNGVSYGLDAASGERLAPGFGGATLEDVDAACGLAWSAFDLFRETSLEARAEFLDTIAANILALGDGLIERCVAESGLPRARIEGERARTVGQLRMFADVVRSGDFLEVRMDPAQPERKPLPRANLRMRHIGLGPVAVFGASNFPLAFSVAGGDTASAFAAGCPVIVKAHAAHPGTSELVGVAVRQAVEDCGMPEGTFSLLFGSGREIGQGLVRDPRIKAVGFTGSRQAGTDLMAVAAARPEPIPVYAEMSSINPVILFPHALEQRGEEIAQAFVQSLTLGAGQFCTNPGLILAVQGPALERFVVAASEALTRTPAATMLTPSIHRAFEKSVANFSAHPHVQTVARAQPAAGANEGQGALFSTTVEAFREDALLRDEIFGAASLIVRCPDLQAMHALIESLEGQLTAALHIDEADYSAVRPFLPVLERRVGRVLVNGFGTGVEVSHAMVHGGPYPSTADGRSTSVGSLAIRRYLRPVCYQDMPEVLLPEALRVANPWKVNRLVDGKIELA
ncbi:Alpha-ketoglutaric semialdehyde dehydrogenase 3 [Bordetella tumbae]|uniref:aldehyde dehydrogenase (NADP(+)) n=1 Tax=Bordetella tumbae TaxID=1649139 RepID=UPI0039F0F73A